MLASSEAEADGAWHERWMASLAPIAGLAPARRARSRGPSDPSGRIIIRLTPGRAFGTGEHATTRMCLELMESHGTARGSVLDVGTGSGILAIAAWRLGCRPVTALDTDPEAVSVAARNATLNGCAGPTPSSWWLARWSRSARSGWTWCWRTSPEQRSNDSCLDWPPARGAWRSSRGSCARRRRRSALAREEGLSLWDRRAEGDWCALALGKTDV